MTFTRDDLKRVIWTFLFAFLTVFSAGLTDLLGAFKAGGLDGVASAGLALAVAALAAGMSAIKNLLLADGSTLK